MRFHNGKVGTNRLLMLSSVADQPSWQAELKPGSIDFGLQVLENAFGIGD